VSIGAGLEGFNSSLDFLRQLENLVDISISEGSEFFKAIDGVVYNKEVTQIIFYPKKKSATTYEILSSVTSIGEYAFLECKNLTSIVIPTRVTFIGTRAFFFCTNLTIYVESESRPAGWSSYWNNDNLPVIWGFSE
jgi:hypothetical protein